VRTREALAAATRRAAQAEQRAEEAERRAEEAERRAEEAEQRAEEAEQRVAALEKAVMSRPTIDQAKGVIMAVFGLGPEDAFESLVWVSQQANVKLARIAERFINDVRGTDLGCQAPEALTDTLAGLAGRPRNDAQ
jgi:multidrug resistance efflux pump